MHYLLGEQLSLKCLATFYQMQVFRLWGHAVFQLREPFLCRSITYICHLFCTSCIYWCFPRGLTTNKSFKEVSFKAKLNGYIIFFNKTINKYLIIQNFIILFVFVYSWNTSCRWTFTNILLNIWKNLDLVFTLGKKFAINFSTVVWESGHIKKYFFWE